MISIRDISDEILLARKKRKLKQEALGLVVGCSGSYITKIERGQVLPSVQLAMRLEAALKLKKGSLFSRVLAIKARELALKRAAVIVSREGSESPPPPDGHVMVPVLRASPKEWIETVERYIAVPKPEADGAPLFFITIQDDALENAGVLKGDLILVRRGKGQDGKLCVYCVGADYHIKRLKKGRNGAIQFIAESGRLGQKSLEKNIDYKNDSAIAWKGVVEAIYLKKINR